MDISNALARRERADKYIPAQLSILADYFRLTPSDIRLATPDEDIRQATDVVLPTGETVGLRVRQPHQIKHYGDFIIRHQPYPRYPTEYDKLLNGKPDYLLYGIAKDASRLGSWWIINCEAIRAAHRNGWRCTTPPDYRSDGIDGFQTFKLSGFLSKPKLVLASSDSSFSSTDQRCKACRRFV